MVGLENISRNIITEDISAFLDALSLNRVNLVGVSRGGQIATFVGHKEI